MFRTAAGTALLFAAATTAMAAEPAPPVSASKLNNAETARRKLGLYPSYPTVPSIGRVKVAVLDSGFDRIDGKRPYLPKTAEVVEHYDPAFVRQHGLGDPDFQKPFALGEAHGRLMAQIVWAASGGSPFGPKFYLLNANGPTLFRRAVRYAIEQKVDVILFSGTFEGAGNFDGRGPINAAVDDAVAAGIIWVNAAGNAGGAVYNGPVSVDPSGYLTLRAGADPTALRLANRLDENAVTVTLTWNDYRDAEDAGTDKDLDLVVEDWLGRVVGESTLRQVPAGRAAAAGETKNPRERLAFAELPAKPAGEEYRIRVRAKSSNFGPRDRIRILVSSGRPAPVTDPATGKVVIPVELLDASTGGEIYPPADHAGVLAVGDATPQSAVGPTADGRSKPDVVIDDSVARFSNGDESVGSSNAAAYFAGIAAVLRAGEPGLTAGHLRDWVRRLDRGKAVADAKVPPRVLESAPLSPNQVRALRYAANALEEKRLRGERNPEVIVSNPGGAVVLTQKSRSSEPPVPEAGRRGASVHAGWFTPTPRELATLVRGLPGDGSK
ncbi:S8 family serine peptidase [Limnoglobus roseus]|uniref:Peptidase S8/S53 domain-containing protein n=1 Tax=Limnoglobus roseus TaxID=2598579 RepID=A0A5C1AU04_9BACT|nr:S8 family serine peptidase [Limnoglobus roseus]QEL20704.1 hypothetical protein PX52LOC_07813 [Limnoglobus roseus]